MYEVEICKSFKTLQGLASPVRNAKNLPRLAPKDGFNIELRVGIVFNHKQLNDRGWFVDTDALDNIIEAQAKYLSSDRWTELFSFRPTFELVTKWTYGQLKNEVDGLKYVELRNNTVGVITRYSTQ